jgi:hypothetical protein
MYKDKVADFLPAANAELVKIPSSIYQKGFGTVTVTNTNTTTEVVDMTIVRANGAVEYLLGPAKNMTAKEIIDDIAVNDRLYAGDAVWGCTTTASKVAYRIQFVEV